MYCSYPTVWFPWCTIRINTAKPVTIIQKLLKVNDYYIFFLKLKTFILECVLQLFTLNKHTFLKFLANQFVENLSIILLVNYVMHHVLVVHGRDQKGVRVAHEIPCNITQKPASIFLDDNGTMPNFDFGGSVWWVPFIMEIVCIFVVATLITVFKQFLKLTMKCNGYF